MTEHDPVDPAPIVGEVSPAVTSQNRFGEPALEALKRASRGLPAVQSIYHYTDANAFKSMMELGTLWFTDAAFLNDGSETTWGSRSVR